MRVLIVTPLQPQATGNQITARRHQDELRQLGHETQLVMTAEENPALLRRALKETRPDLVHLLHAYRAGRPWLACRDEHPSPWVVTLTGTDINHDIHTAAKGPIIREVLDGASAIISQNRFAIDELAQHYPQWRDRLRYLPAGTVPGSTPYPMRQMYGIPAGTLIFFLPAGIRPVKGNLELLRLFDRLAELRNGFLVVFSGPVLDEEYAGRFFAALAERPWARYLDIIPSTAMAAAMREADVVLNHSVSEGMPNTLIEAAALGRPLLVRDIPGNAAVIEAGINGLLYRDADDFTSKALALLDDADLRRSLSRPDPEHYSAAREAQALVEIYREAQGRD